MQTMGNSYLLPREIAVCVAHPLYEIQDHLNCRKVRESNEAILTGIDFPFFRIAIEEGDFAIDSPGLPQISPHHFIILLVGPIEGLG